MSKMATMGVFDIEFTGGEFFTHKNANIVLSEAIEHGFVISILTNATLIDNKRARHIASLFPRNVQISVYSINSEIHDKITGVNGSLVKTIKGIKHLIDAGIRPIIACPLTIINKDCVDEITKWASELCLDVKFSLKLSHSENSERSPQSLRLKPNSIRDFTRDARVNPFLRNDIKTLSRVDQNSKLLCQAGYRNFALDGFGNMYPCNSLRMGCGNVLDTDIFQLWKNSQEMTHWRNISINSYNKCSMCEAKFVCSPCPADNFSEFHELANISSQDCRVGWETYLAWKENI
jgi:radical SAM protein with 4Fe4S-binding SPASM domain